jgi:hypothetical protein
VTVPVDVARAKNLRSYSNKSPGKCNFPLLVEVPESLLLWQADCLNFTGESYVGWSGAIDLQGQRSGMRRFRISNHIFTHGCGERY